MGSLKTRLKKRTLPRHVLRLKICFKGGNEDSEKTYVRSLLGRCFALIAVVPCLTVRLGAQEWDNGSYLF